MAMTSAACSGRLISADPRPKTFLKSPEKGLLLTQENFNDIITLPPRQTFLIQSLEQSLGCQIRFFFRQYFGLAQLFVKDILLRARRKVRTRRHRDSARKHGGQTCDDDNHAALSRALNARQQPDGAYQAVLNSENKLAYASAAFDELFLLFDGPESHSHQYFRARSPVGSPGRQSDGQRRSERKALRTRSVSSTLRPTFGVTHYQIRDFSGGIDNKCCPQTYALVFIQHVVEPANGFVLVTEQGIVHAAQFFGPF